MKYIQQISGALVSSSILLFFFSIILYLFYPIRYIGNADAIILMQAVLLLVFISVIVEIGNELFEK